ncbi:hypothetical protein F0U60_07945 [Archangium minus]|uniref:Uncharacterized protein n=1 Tax=Archangium minus TaxID=83450 RepID=A0ABY9WJS4_9BACT|nr:hypothetical protein F0U60_07945 [Archangium minus]
MKSLSRRASASLAAASLALLTELPMAAHAYTYTYSSAYINDWSNCDSPCSNYGHLNYTDEQINMFDSRMTVHGNTRKHKYSNTSVWASDYIEDQLSFSPAYSMGGQDYYHTDDSEMVAYAGQGRSFSYTVDSGQLLQMHLCKKGTAANGCWINSDYIRFGEQRGEYALNPGQARFMLLMVDFSVDERPNEQWGQAMYRGLEYTMGYRGWSSDDARTDEVGGDWADKAMGESWTFKSAWFWAVEDWWLNDVGSLVSVGVNAAEADIRRDNLDKNWAPRSALDVSNWYSWSYHQG